jgi:hypothetical protein
MQGQAGQMQGQAGQTSPRPLVAPGRGRRGPRAWMVGVALSVVAALVLGLPAMGRAGGDDDGDDHDFPCKGLKGTCFGLCLAEVIARCDEKPDTIICRLLERQQRLHKCTEPTEGCPPGIPGPGEGPCSTPVGLAQECSSQANEAACSAACQSYVNRCSLNIPSPSGATPLFESGVCTCTLEFTS